MPSVQPCDDCDVFLIRGPSNVLELGRLHLQISHLLYALTGGKIDDARTLVRANPSLRWLADRIIALES